MLTPEARLEKHTLANGPLSFDVRQWSIMLLYMEIENAASAHPLMSAPAKGKDWRPRRKNQRMQNQRPIFICLRDQSSHANPLVVA